MTYVDLWNKKAIFIGCLRIYANNFVLIIIRINELCLFYPFNYLYSLCWILRQYIVGLRLSPIGVDECVNEYLIKPNVTHTLFNLNIYVLDKWMKIYLYSWIKFIYTCKWNLVTPIDEIINYLHKIKNVVMKNSFLV